jgi:hypothetical protein
MHDPMADRGRCRRFGVGKKSSNSDNASRWLESEAISESNVFPRESWAWILPSLPPIDSISPEISTSVREGATRYNPNLSEEEPLFSASTFRPGCASIMA